MDIGFFAVVVVGDSVGVGKVVILVGWVLVGRFVGLAVVNGFFVVVVVGFVVAGLVVVVFFVVVVVDAVVVVDVVVVCAAGVGGVRSHLSK